jgi:hypothetical protein
MLELMVQQEQLEALALKELMAQLEPRVLAQQDLQELQGQ